MNLIPPTLPGWLPRLLRIAVFVLLVLGVGGFLIDGANRPADPYLVPAGAGGSGVGGAGVGGTAGVGGSAALSINPRGGGHHTVCTLVARTEAQREQGLMGRHSLGGYAGMSFAFDGPSNDAFYMKDTLIPLSVAWFDGRGGYIASAQMSPCRTSTACPTYSSPQPYTLALEVPAGGLAGMGIGAGTTVALGGPCSV
jgi:hypothetical protein